MSRRSYGTVYVLDLFPVGGRGLSGRRYWRLEFGRYGSKNRRVYELSERKLKLKQAKLAAEETLANCGGEPLDDWIGPVRYPSIDLAPRRAVHGERGCYYLRYVLKPSIGDDMAVMTEWIAKALDGDEV